MLKQNILYCGNGFLGLNILKILHSSHKFEIITFIRTKNQKRKSASKIQKFCTKQKIRIIFGESLTHIKSKLKNLNISFIFICSYGELIAKAFLNDFLVINLHPSLLPKYRGPTPIVSALLNNENVIGISLMKTVCKIDAGNLYVQKEIILDHKLCNLNTAYLAIIYECKLNLVLWLESIISGKLDAKIEQNEDNATYCYKFSKCFNEIDLNKPHIEVITFVNALMYHYKPFIKIAKKKLIVCEINSNFEFDKWNIKKFNFGDIVDFNNRGLFIKCKTGVVKITKMQWPGRKIQNCFDFYNGYYQGIKITVK